MSDRRKAEIFIPYYDGTLYVVYDYFAGRPGRMYLRNGDPGYPEEPPEADLVGVAAHPDGEDILEILSDTARGNIIDACLEYEDERRYEGCEEE